MKNILLSFLLFISTLLNAQWDKTVFDKDNIDNRLGIADFTLNGEGIWAASSLGDLDTNIYYSSDGGYNFKKIPFSFQSDSIRIFSIEAISEKKVFVLCLQTYNIFYSKYLYKQSEDEGKTWQPFYILNNNDTAFKNNKIESLFFYDSLNGTAIGGLSNNDKEIWNTTDGGQSWRYLPCDSIKLPNCARNFPLTKSNIFSGTTIYRHYNYNQKVYMPKSYNYGKNWEMVETNLTYNVGSISLITFKDSLTGLGIYHPKNPELNGKFLAFTNDGGRTWDTTYPAPDNDNGIIIHFIPPASASDSGFWIGYSSNFDNMKFIMSYDNFKTYKKVDDYLHNNLFYYNTKKIISSVDLKENLFIYTGKENNAGFAKNISKNNTVYPNPFQDEIHIKTSQLFSLVPQKNSEIKIYNLEGKSLLTQTINSGESILKLNDFVAGIYLLEIKTDNQTERIKLVKTN